MSNFNKNKILPESFYTANQISLLLGCHYKTVLNLLGIKPVNPTQKPYFYSGKDILLAIQKKENNQLLRKEKTLKNECKCFSCKIVFKIEEVYKEEKIKNCLIVCPHCGATRFKCLSNNLLKTIRVNMLAVGTLYKKPQLSKGTPLHNELYLLKKESKNKGMISTVQNSINPCVKTPIQNSLFDSSTEKENKL